MTRQPIHAMLTLILLGMLGFAPATTVAREAARCYLLTDARDWQHRDLESLWQGIPGIAGFPLLGELGFASDPGFFKIAHTEQALFLYVVFYEGDLAKLRCEEENGGQVWQDDSVEFFVSPDEGRTVYQFVVNACGARYHAPPEGRDYDPLTSWDARVEQDDGYWRVMLHIPFEILGRTAGEGEPRWLFAVGRNDRGTRDELSAWPRLGKNAYTFRLPQEWALLQFHSALSADPQAMAYEARQNEPYVDYLHKVTSIAKQEFEYLKGLATAPSEDVESALQRVIYAGSSLDELHSASVMRYAHQLRLFLTQLDDFRRDVLRSRILGR